MPTAGDLQRSGDGQGPLICGALPPIQTLSAVTGIISAGHELIYMERIWCFLFLPKGQQLSLAINTTEAFTEVRG